MSRKLLVNHLTRALMAVAALSLLCATCHAQFLVVEEDFESYALGDFATYGGGPVGTISLFDGNMTSTAQIIEYPTASGNQALRFAFDVVQDAVFNQNILAPFPMPAMNNPSVLGSDYILEYDAAIRLGPNDWWAFGGVVEVAPPALPPGTGTGPYGVNIDTAGLTVGGDFSPRSGNLADTVPFGDLGDFSASDWSYRVVALAFSSNTTDRVQMVIDNIRVLTFVPEPSSALLGVLSAGALCFVRRQRRDQS
jgi:hypothetical protein